MGLRERIDVVLGLDNKGFLSSLTAVKTQVGAADGFMGKLKAGTQGLGDAFSAAAKNPAIMGAALGAVGKTVVDLAGDYADLGLEIGKFSDSTGASTEDSGRFIEVANDLGISVGTMESAIGRMNKKVAETPALFKKLNIDTTDLAGGQLSAKDTFLNTIGALSKMDERARSSNGSRIFGKGWQAASELVAMGADKAKERLDAVSDTKAFSEKEVAKAREYRDALDNISDAADDAKLVLGKMAVDGLLPVVKVLGQIQDASGPLQSVLEDLKFALDIGTNPINVYNTLSDTFDSLTESGAVTYSVLGDLGHALVRTYSSASDAADGIEHLGLTNSEATLAVKDMKQAVADSNTALEVAARLAQEAADAAKAYQDSITELYSAQRSIIDGTVEYQRSIEDTDSALKNLDKVTKDHKSTTDDITSATNQAYDAIVKQSEGYATLEGASLDSVGGTQRQIDALGLVRSTLAPGSPLQAALDQYIWKLSELQKTITTKLVLTMEQSGNIGSLHDSVVHSGSYKATESAGKRGLRTQSLGGASVSRGLRTQGFTGADGSVWDQVLAPPDPAIVDDIVATVTETTAAIESTEVDLARRRFKRGEINLEQYKQVVDAQLAKSDEANGKMSADSESLFDLQSSLTNEIASIAAKAEQDRVDAAKAAADAIVEQQKKEQDARDATLKKIQDQVKAELGMANNRVDLEQAITAQANAQTAFNQALTAYGALTSEATADERAAALTKVAQAQQDLDSKTIAGAKARAALAGEVGSAAYENGLNSDLSSYANSHGDPTGALAQEAARHVFQSSATGFTSSGATNNVYISTGADPRQVIEIVKRYTSNGGVL